MALDPLNALRRAWTLPIWTVLAACAAVHAPPPGRPSMSAEEEAQAVEAARHHPIARPEARTLYPEQAPPPLPAHGAPSVAPPGMQPAGLTSAAEPASETVVAPTPPPNDYVDQPQYAAPGPDYVWVPGYWGWSGASYTWIAGDWLRSRPGYVYVGPRWARTGYGWQFSVGGWARGGTGIVIYPVHRYPYSSSYQPYYTPGYYSSRRLGSPSYGGRPGYRAPPSRYSAPTGHVMPDARGFSRDSYGPQRGAEGRSDRSRPQAAPSSASRPSSSAPRPPQTVHVGGGGGRSSSQRATVRTRH